MTQQKTYWHLLDLRRRPTDYELVTSAIHYYRSPLWPERGFEIGGNQGVGLWYKQYQDGSPFQCSNWEKFYDPEQYTYQKYVNVMMARETFVDGLLEEIEMREYDKGLSEAWRRILERTVSPFRYPGMGLQMIAAYVGQMGPSARITTAGTMQAGDEIRRVQRIAYRTRLLQLAYPGFAENSKALWEEDALWQPLREAIEKLLIAYDWGESFAGLNLVLKPMVDELFMTHLSELGRREGDYILGELFFSLNHDCRWHRDWSQALVKMAVEDTPANKGVLQGWINKWYPLAERAVTAFEPVFEEMPGRPKTLAFAEVVQQIKKDYSQYLNSMGLEKPSS